MRHARRQIFSLGRVALEGNLECGHELRHGLDLEEVVRLVAFAPNERVPFHLAVLVHDMELVEGNRALLLDDTLLVRLDVEVVPRGGPGVHREGPRPLQCAGQLIKMAPTASDL